MISNMAQQDSIVNLQTLRIGPFPLSMIRRGRYSDRFFTMEGKLFITTIEIPNTNAFRSTQSVKSTLSGTQRTATKACVNR